MSRSNPTAPVIIPIYNRAKLVVQALDSVLSQTRPPDEVVVFDDGSTDATAEILCGYGDLIHYLHQTNAELEYFGVKQYGMDVSPSLAIEK
jgi:glycosyltransferase involved in cell wall biosynthesis